MTSTALDDEVMSSKGKPIQAEFRVLYTRRVDKMSNIESVHLLSAKALLPPFRSIATKQPRTPKWRGNTMTAAWAPIASHPRPAPSKTANETGLIHLGAPAK